MCGVKQTNKKQVEVEKIDTAESQRKRRKKRKDQRTEVGERQRGIGQ